MIETERIRRGTAAAAVAALVGVGALVGGTTYAEGASTPAAAAYGPSKVTVCHHTKAARGGRHVNLRVAPAAVRAHLRHGDVRGVCSTRRATKTRNSAAHIKRFHKAQWKAVLKAKAKKKRR
jgi:hypothetical protein